MDRHGPKALLRFWYSYKSFVEKRTCEKNKGQLDNIDGWKQRLFTNFITYVLPSCLIALIPGVYMSIKGGFMVVGVCDILAVLSIALISLNTYIKLYLKKILVVAVLYILSFILLINLSLLGPGVIYLLALSIVITITCKPRLAYSTIAINFFVCVLCAFVIHFELLDVKLVADYSLGAWIAVSSNLVFLTFVLVMLVSKTIQVLESTIAKELSLKNELYQKSAEQWESNKLIMESEGHYKSLFFRNPSPMWVLQMETYQFLQVNEAAVKKYGYTNEEFLSMSIMDIKIENDDSAVKNYLEENKKGGTPLALVAQHRKKDGEEFYVEVIFNTIPFMGNVAILAISNDITEQMNYLKSIQEQNEKLKEIAWIQCHKVRAPLASILGLIQLYKEPGLNVPTEEIILGILKSAEQLDSVIAETVLKSN